MTNITDYDYERYLNDTYIELKMCQHDIYGYNVLKNYIGCEIRIIILYLHVVKIYYINNESVLYNIVDCKLEHSISDILINTINKYCDMFNNKQLWCNMKEKIRSKYYNNCNLYLDQDFFIEKIIKENIKCFNL